jgi:hypothetical protein
LLTSREYLPSNVLLDLRPDEFAVGSIAPAGAQGAKKRKVDEDELQQPKGPPAKKKTSAASNPPSSAEETPVPKKAHPTKGPTS